MSLLGRRVRSVARVVALGASLGASAGAALGAVSCGDNVPVVPTGPSYTIEPANGVSLDVGDSATVTVRASTTKTVLVRWTCSDPTVATVDPVVELNAPARVRALRRGSAILNAVITSGNETAVASVPVRVSG